MLLWAAALLACAAAAPCDILGDCVAAHSMVRALYSAYAGPLYQVLRATDNATLDIPLLRPGGLVNAQLQDAFCSAGPPTPPGPALPPLGTTLSLRPAHLPTFSFRHCDAQAYITPAADGSDDHRFTLVAALSGQPGAVSFRSVNFPTYYIAPMPGGGGRLGVVQQPVPGAASWDLTPSGAGFELRSSGQAMALGANLTGTCAPNYAPPAVGVFLGGGAATTWLLSPPPAPPCVVRRIYDQSPQGNHLDTAPPGGAVARADLPVNAAAFPMAVGTGAARVKAYGAYFQTGMGYRRDNTTGVAKGNDPETIYAVYAGKPTNRGCCMDWGNGEHNDHDDGAGTMEAVYWGSWDATGSGWCGGVGSTGPWIMADLEDGLWACNDTRAVNPRALPLDSADFVVGMVKGGQEVWAIKAGDVNGVGGGLLGVWEGPRPRGYAPMRKQGSIILGIGGDNSDSAVGVWVEGVMTSSYSSEAVDAALAVDLKAAGFALAA